eukprot:5592792-Pyramimonas_sp.AAC.1
MPTGSFGASDAQARARHGEMRGLARGAVAQQVGFVRGSGRAPPWGLSLAHQVEVARARSPWIQERLHRRHLRRCLEGVMGEPLAIGFLAMPRSSGTCGQPGRRHPERRGKCPFARWC